MKGLFASTNLYSSSPILPPAAFPALPARGGAAGRPHFHLVVFEVVLLEHAEARVPGPAGRPRTGPLLSSKTAKEHRLSGAVGTYPSVTVADGTPAENRGE